MSHRLSIESGKDPAARWAEARFDDDPRDGPIWAHFVAVARLVYVKYTAAIAV